MPSVTVFEAKFDSNIGRPAVRMGEPDFNLYLAPLIIKTKPVGIFVRQVKITLLHDTVHYSGKPLFDQY